MPADIGRCLDEAGPYDEKKGTRLLKLQVWAGPAC